MNGHDSPANRGWAARPVDIAPGLRGPDLATADFAAAAARWLRAANGVEFSMPAPGRSFWIDVERAGRDLEQAWCDAYRAELGKPFLVMVGELGPMMIMLDEQGEFWGGFDQEYGWLAHTLPDLVAGLLGFVDSPSLDRVLPD